MSELNFERGSADRPRGHAFLYFRDASNPDSLRASYLIVLPIAMDLSKYIPPAFSGGMGGGAAAGDAASIQVLPWPPIPEAVPSQPYLVSLAEAREDDLLYAGTADFSRPDVLLPRTAEAAQRYLEQYQLNLVIAAEPASAGAEPTPELDVDEVLYGLMSERDRLSELVKRTGQLRDAVEANDRREVESLLADLKGLTKYFPPKYRLDEYLSVAAKPGPAGRRLTELYVDRCYRVLNEDYEGLRSLDEQIAEVTGK